MSLGTYILFIGLLGIDKPFQPIITMRGPEEGPVYNILGAANMFISKVRLNIMSRFENKYGELEKVKNKDVQFYGCEIWQYYEDKDMFIGILNSNLKEQVDGYLSDIQPVVVLKSLDV